MYDYYEDDDADLDREETDDDIGFLLDLESQYEEVPLPMNELL
jgi:hypothetical protein